MALVLLEKVDELILGGVSIYVYTLVRPRQPENAPEPMLVTLEGMVMLFSAVHCLNAFSPMVLKPSDKTMFVRDEQLANADVPMLVTLPGMIILVRFVQPLNAVLYMFVTPSGIVTLISPVHPENAASPIAVT